MASKFKVENGKQSVGQEKNSSEWLGKVDSEFLTIQEVSEYLHIKTSTLYSKVEAGDLPHYKIGHLIRFKQSDIRNWIETHRKDPSDANKRARAILKTTQKNNLDINQVVKKSIAEVKRLKYTPSHGRPDQIKGLRKEVSDGTL